jgi:hypothetical protein
MWVSSSTIKSFIANNTLIRNPASALGVPILGVQADRERVPTIAKEPEGNIKFFRGARATYLVDPAAWLQSVRRVAVPGADAERTHIVSQATNNRDRQLSKGKETRK